MSWKYIQLPIGLAMLYFTGWSLAFGSWILLPNDYGELKPYVWNNFFQTSLDVLHSPATSSYPWHELPPYILEEVRSDPSGEKAFIDTYSANKTNITELRTNGYASNDGMIAFTVRGGRDPIGFVQMFRYDLPTFVNFLGLGGGLYLVVAGFISLPYWISGFHSKQPKRMKKDIPHAPKFVVGDSFELENPTADEIRYQLSKLGENPEDYFATLSISSNNSLQVAGNEEEGFMLQFADPQDDYQYKVVVTRDNQERLFSLDQVVPLLIAYLNHDAYWNDKMLTLHWTELGNSSSGVNWSEL